MLARPITPHGAIDDLLTGYFDVKRDYFTWRPAGTKDFLLIYTLAGRGRFGDGRGGEFFAVPHGLTLLRPGAFHDYSTATPPGRWKFVWAHFVARADWLDLLHWPALAPGLHQMQLAATGQPAIARRAIARQFLDVHGLASATGPLRKRLAMNALERLLLLCDEQNPHRAAHEIDPRARRVMDYVGRNLHHPLSLDVLAAVAGLSVSRLGHSFRDVAGCSPMAFVERMRIDRAKQLLTMTSFSVKEVAAQVGYDGQFYFSLRFKRQTGMSPTAFREANGQAPPH